MSEFDPPEQFEYHEPDTDRLQDYELTPLDIVRLGSWNGSLFAVPASPYPLIVPSEDRRGRDRGAISPTPEPATASEGTGDELSPEKSAPEPAAPSEQPSDATRGSALRRHLGRLLGRHGSSKGVEPAEPEPESEHQTEAVAAPSAELVVPGQGDDGPYEQTSLVDIGREGGAEPARELTDEAHAIIRANELVEQAEHPRPEPVPIPGEEIPQEATTLIGALQHAAGSRQWDEVREGVNWDGKTIRTYSVAIPAPPGEPEFRRTHMTIQLGYDTADSALPSLGSMELFIPAGRWRREYHFQADISANAKGGPHIRYDDYPFHEEELGRPQTNTQFALEQARRLIARLHISS